MALGRFDAEGFAVKIQVEPPRRAVASAHAVKGELLREVAMRVGRVTVAEPVFFRDRHVQNRRAQVKERHVEAASVEGDDGIEIFHRVPELREQFRFVRAGNEFHRRVFLFRFLEIFRDKQGLAALRLGV